METETEQFVVAVIKPDLEQIKQELPSPVKTESSLLSDGESDQGTALASVLGGKPLCVKTEPPDDSSLDLQEGVQPSVLSGFSVSLLKNKLNARLKGIVSSNCSSPVNRVSTPAVDRAINVGALCKDDTMQPVCTEYLDKNSPLDAAQLDSQSTLSSGPGLYSVPNGYNGFSTSLDFSNNIPSAKNIYSEDMDPLSISVGVRATPSEELSTIKDLGRESVTDSLSTAVVLSTTSSEKLASSNIEDLVKESVPCCSSTKACGISAVNGYNLSEETYLSTNVEVSTKNQPSSSILSGLSDSEDDAGPLPSVAVNIKSEPNDEYEDESLQDAVTLQNTIKSVCVKAEPVDSDELILDVDDDSVIYDESIHDDDSLHEGSFHSGDGTENRENYSVGSSLGLSYSVKSGSVRSDSVMSGSVTGSGNETGDDAPTEAQQMENIDRNKPSTGPLMRECRWAYTKKNKYKTDKVIVMDTSSISIERRDRSDSVLSGSVTGSGNETGDDGPTEAQQMENIDKNKPSTGPLMKECRWAYTKKNKYKTDKVIVMDTSSISIERRVYAPRANTKYPNTCYICSEILPSKEALDGHRKAHKGKGAYMCELCGKNFHSKGTRNVHMKYHENKKCYECDQCDKFYISEQAYKNHQLIHEKGGNFKCDKCGRVFLFRSSWFSHQRAHTGDGNHECSKCGKCFVHEKSLANHMTLAHEPPKVVACEYCGKRVRDSGLERHKERRHGKKPRKCEICTKIFTDFQQYQLHYLSHDDEELYNCPCCDKRYTQRERWRYHVGYHHGVKVSVKKDIDYTWYEERRRKKKRKSSEQGEDTHNTREREHQSCFKRDPNCLESGAYLF